MLIKLAICVGIVGNVQVVDINGKRNFIVNKTIPCEKNVSASTSTAESTDSNKESEETSLVYVGSEEDWVIYIDPETNAPLDILKKSSTLRGICLAPKNSWTRQVCKLEDGYIAVYNYTVENNHLFEKEYFNLDGKTAKTKPNINYSNGKITNWFITIRSDKGPNQRIKGTDPACIYSYRWKNIGEWSPERILCSPTPITEYEEGIN